MRSFIFSFIFLAVPGTVLACEDECMAGVTNAWLGNYTTSVQDMWKAIVSIPQTECVFARLICLQAVQMGNAVTHHRRRDTDKIMSYMQPLLAAYDNSSYDSLKFAIFPSHFHGKCQQNGVDPPGCPNPDCPVVCGTPGSLVHFYAVLRHIVFKTLLATITNITTPGSDSYNQVEDAFVKDASQPARMVRWYVRSREGGNLDSRNRNLPYMRKREEKMRTQFKAIMKRAPILLANACGEPATDANDALPGCSWNATMIPYILSFP